MPSAFLFRVVLCCLLLQLASVTLQPRDNSSPNAATMIATALVERGEYAVHAWPRTRTTASGEEAPLRAYHLPGEPLLVAAGLRVLPPVLLPYLHIPITVLFVTAVAAIGCWVGGRALGLTAGVIASLDPFLIAHGSVWDDTFLAAALGWTIFAMLVRTAATGGGTPSPTAIALIAILAGTAAITRSSSQVILAIVAVGLIVRPASRPLRAAGVAMLAAIAIALAGWGLRNHVVAGAFRIGSSHDGITLFESNYATARPSLWRTGSVERYSIEDLGAHFAAVATMAEFDADRYFKRQAIAYAMDHPLDVATTASLKLVVSLTGVDLGQPMSSARNLIATAVSVGLIAGGVYGWRRSRWGTVDRPEIRTLAFLCLVVVSVTCVGLLAGPTGMRYRLDAAGFAYLGAAAAITSFARSRTASRRRV